MKTQWWKTLLAICLIVTATGWGQTFAADTKEVNIDKPAVKEPPAAPDRAMDEIQFDTGPQHFERMLNRIKETDPQKADELAKLREKDPNAFRLELRKFMRERMRDQMMEQKGMPGKGKHGPEGPMPKGPMPEGFGPEMFHQRMQERGEEYMKWLKENYLDEATKLEQLKKENPEQYMRAMALSGRKYGRIFDASKDNPQLAAVLKEQLPLKEKRADLVRQIKAATDEKQKEELAGQLEKVVSQQFDLIVKRKQLACEDLTKKLTELNKELEQKKTDIEKWKSLDFKNEKVKQRVNELLAETEKFEWE